MEYCVVGEHEAPSVDKDDDGLGCCPACELKTG